MKLQEVPKVGDKHSFFDDGKMCESRHYMAEVLRVITPDEAKQITFNLINYDDWNSDLQDYNIKENITKTLYEVWREEVDAHRQRDCFTVLTDGAKTTPGSPWCYAEETDFFIECSIPKYDEHTIWFVRHVSGGWFSMDIQQSWMSGTLMPIDFDFNEYLIEEEKAWKEWLEKNKKK
jgi:hypothetical protein